MEKITDIIPEKALEEALEKISLENFSDLDLSSSSFRTLDPEQVGVETSIMLGKFSNIDAQKSIVAALETFKTDGDFQTFQWTAGNALMELGEQHNHKLILALEKEDVSDPIRTIPAIASALLLYNRVHDKVPDDVGMIQLKNEILTAVAIFAGNGRVYEALQILAEIEIPSILKEGKERFLTSLILIGDPKVGAKIIEKIDPNAQLLPLRGVAISRLVKEGEIELAVPLAKGRDAKGKVPSTYYNIPLGYLQKGNIDKAVEVTKILFPETRLSLQSLQFAWNWCRDNGKIETFEAMVKKLPTPGEKNGAYISLFTHYHSIGLSGLAEPYGEKIDFDLYLSELPKGTTPLSFCRTLGNIHPKLQELAMEHFGL